MTRDDYFKMSKALDTTDYDYLDVLEDIIDRVDDEQRYVLERIYFCMYEEFER